MNIPRSFIHEPTQASYTRTAEVYLMRCIFRVVTSRHTVLRLVPVVRLVNYFIAETLITADVEILISLSNEMQFFGRQLCLLRHN